MSLRDQLATFRTLAASQLAEVYGQTINIRGVEITGIVSAPKFSIVTTEGGDQVRVECVAAIPISSLDPGPRRWEPVTLASGRLLVVAESRTDEHRGEHVMSLSSAGAVHQF